MIESINFTRIGLIFDLIGAALVAMDLWMTPKKLEDFNKTTESMLANSKTPCRHSIFEALIFTGNSFRNVETWRYLFMVASVWLTRSFKKPRLLGLSLMLMGFFLQFIATFV